ELQVQRGAGVALDREVEDDRAVLMGAVLMGAMLVRLVRARAACSVGALRAVGAVGPSRPVGAGARRVLAVHVVLLEFRAVPKDTVRAQAGRDCSTTSTGPSAVRDCSAASHTAAAT